jgi:hypothetical protein
MELKNFNDFIAEAKDSQKSKVNNDMHSKDATHGEKPQVLDTKVKADGNNYEGDKPDILDTSINEADAQKEKENSDLKAKDASHGEKAQVIKEDGEDDDEDDEDDDDDDEKVLHGEKCDGDLKESFTPNFEENANRKLGDKVIKDGKEKKSTILDANNGYIKFVEVTSDGIIIHEIDKNKHISITIDNDEIKYLKK